VHRVDAVVIGGLGGFLHGVPIARSMDADLCASRDPANIGRLVAALRDIGAVLRDTQTGDPIPGVPVSEDLFGPGQQTLIFATEHGPVDVAFTPDGTTGYTDLDRDATTVIIRRRGDPRRLGSRHREVETGREPRKGPGDPPRLRRLHHGPCSEVTPDRLQVLPVA